MSGIFYIIFMFAIVSLVMSMFRNQGRNYRGRNMGPNDQYIHTNNTMHTGAGDMNFNGVPDYMEQNQLDRDHDGIPDYMEQYPGSFDGSSNDAGSSFDFGSADTGSFDSGSFDAGGSDFGGGSLD